MKKPIVLLLIIIMMFSVCVSANATHVYDEMNVLGDYKYVLENMSQQLIEKHEIYPNVVVADSVQYSQRIANMYANYDVDNYVILHISTSEDGSYRYHSVLYSDEYVSVFEGKFTRKVNRAIKPYLSVDDYSGAAECFFEIFDKHIGNVNKHPVNAWLKKQLYKHYFLFIGFAIVFMVGLITAFSTVMTHKKKLKNLKSANDAFYYIDNEFLQISATRQSPEDIIDSIFDI